VHHLIDAALEMTPYGLRSADITWSNRAMPTPLINLILNARRALADRPLPCRIVIGTSLSPDGHHLHITVADAIASRILDPFFTTKDVGQGTGLGLSVCKSMAEAHGGKLTLSPTPGGGATFTLILPLQTTGLPNPEPGAPQTAKRRGRILVVVDQIAWPPLGIDCQIAATGGRA